MKASVLRASESGDGLPLLDTGQKQEAKQARRLSKKDDGPVAKRPKTDSLGNDFKV